MTSWRPPGSGSAKPGRRSRRISSRRLIGFGMDRLRVQVDAVDYLEPIAITQADDDPALQSPIELVARFLEGCAFAPSARALVDLSKKRPFSMIS